MGKKSIDLDLLQKEIGDLNSAIEAFDPCYKEFIASVMECMEINNSDFVEAFEKTLRTFMDNKVRRTKEAVSCYYDDAYVVYQIWKGLDENLAGRIWEESET